MKRIKKINRITILTVALILISCVSVFAASFTQFYITDSEVFTSSNEKAVYITGDKIRLINQGNATITATDGAEWHFEVTGEDTETKNYVDFLNSFPNSVKKYSDEEKIKEIFRYAMNNGFITKSSGGSKYDLVNKKPADCDACAELLQDVIRRCNIECNIICESNGHSLNEVYINNKRYEIDLNMFLHYSSNNDKQYYINTMFK